MNNNQIKIVFMGTPEFAIPSLQALIQQGYDVIAVVTQPDRKVGRKQVLTPTPVKREALQHNIPVLQPEKIKEEAAVAQLKALQPDLIVTAAYGQILPVQILQLPKHGCINIHASLLPKYRGGAPIQHAIMNGETITGVTIMYMAEGLDTGDMLSRVEVPIMEDDDAGSLFLKLSEAGAELLITTLPNLLAGHLQAEVQDERMATYAANITRADEAIDWARSTREIYNHIRALHPWPIAYTLWNKERFKIWTSRLPQPADQSSPLSGQVPGTVLQAGAAGIEVKTGDGTIWLTKVQPAGKKAMDAAVFARGNVMDVGTVLGGG